MIQKPTWSRVNLFFKFSFQPIDSAVFVRGGHCEANKDTAVVNDPLIVALSRETAFLRSNV
jgi:hypothetical protein